jgi:Lrp/AsnC family leucine-responsive transcriptional regulator
MPGTSSTGRIRVLNGEAMLYDNQSAMPRHREPSIVAGQNLEVIRRRHPGPHIMKLDKKDRLIITALQQDARQSLSALGKRIGLSQPAVSERVRKLEAAGVISGYAARVDLAAVGLPLQAVVRVRTTHQHLQRYVALFDAMPEVLDAVRVTGDDCFVVRCAFAAPQDLQRVVDALAVHGSVTTALVLSHPVSKNVLPG